MPPIKRDFPQLVVPAFAVVLLGIAIGLGVYTRVFAKGASRAHQIQARTQPLRNTAMDALVAFISDLKAARAAGRPEAELAEVQKLQRRAQFLLDFVEAENSSGFHASQEAVRILGESIDASRRGQLALYAAR